MAKIGRNQPCPCGSGKKYKKCCLNKAKSNSPLVQKRDELDVLMRKGWNLVQANKTAKGCDAWLELWNKLKTRFKPEFRNVDEADSIFSGSELIPNWCQDLEMELGNAGGVDPLYHKKRIAYCNEFCAIFPESSDSILHGMKRAVAESYFALGDVGKGGKCFEELIERYPRNVWGYVGWGDMYLWPRDKSVEPDFEKAGIIYKMGLKKNLESEDVLLERLDSLEKDRSGSGFKV